MRLVLEMGLRGLLGACEIQTRQGAPEAEGHDKGGAMQLEPLQRWRPWPLTASIEM